MALELLRSDAIRGWEDFCFDAVPSCLGLGVRVLGGLKILRSVDFGVADGWFGQVTQKPVVRALIALESLLLSVRRIRINPT